MMKKYAFIIVSLILVCLSVYFIQRWFIKNETYFKSWEFYENDNAEEYDVLFLGSSHIIMSVSPLQIWNDYGWTSYNLADYGQFSTSDYWKLKDALDRTSPKVVVLDAYGVFMEDKYLPGNASNLHRDMDSMPLSINKLQMIMDMIPNDEKLGYFFPLTNIHADWGISSYKKTISTSYSFRGEDLDRREFETNIAITKLDDPRNLDFVTRNENGTISKDYLRKSIELCKESGVKVILLNTPSNYGNETQAWINSVQTIADEYDVEYLDLSELGIVNNLTDFRDEGHVNSSGARKVSEFLGYYIKDKYLSDAEHSEELEKRWDADYADYHNYILEQLKTQTSLDSFLILLSDSGYEYFVEITDMSVVSDEWLVDFWNNLGADVKGSWKDGIILVGNDDNCELYTYENFEHGKQSYEIDTIIGRLGRVNSTEDKSYNYYLDNTEVLPVGENQTGNQAVRFVILDEGEVLYRCTFEMGMERCYRVYCDGEG